MHSLSSAGEIRLRDPLESDVPVFFEHQRDDEALRMSASAAKDLDAFAAHWAKTSADAAVLKKTILVGGAVAGFVASFERLGKKEVCYWLGRGFWGRGIATQGLLAFLPLVKERPLFARVAKRNWGSIRVLEKCGFKKIGEDKYRNALGEEVGEFLMQLDAGQS
jgi:RimJ/RimL family protein N-acetyltransferase